MIGWTSTADPMESVARSGLSFFTREEAEAFCQKHGWAYEVLPSKLQAETRPKRFIGYGDNYRCAAAPSPHVQKLMTSNTCVTESCCRAYLRHVCNAVSSGMDTHRAD